jgi:HEAT repeat protein
MEQGKTVGETALSTLVEQLASKDWRLVETVAKQLLAVGDEGMTAVILGMGHSDSRVRRACAGFFDHHGNDRCLIGLMERVLNDPVPSVRRTAVHSLGCDRCKANPLLMDRIPLLLSVIQKDDNKWVRYEAIWALNASKDDNRYYPLLREILALETDTDILRVAHDVLYHRDPTYRSEFVTRMRSQPR